MCYLRENGGKITASGLGLAAAQIEKFKCPGLLAGLICLSVVMPALYPGAVIRS